MRNVIWIAVLVFTQLLACAEEAKVQYVSPVPESCVPNQSFSCPCVEDGVVTFGVQVCLDDGFSYSPCECSVIPMAAAPAPEKPSEDGSEEPDVVEDMVEPDVVEPDVVEPDVEEEPEIEEDIAEESDTTVIPDVDEPDIEEDVAEPEDAEADVQEDVLEEVEVEEPFAALEVTPTALDFGYIKVGNSLTEKVELVNAGTEPLVLTGVTRSGDTGFGLEVAGVLVTQGNLLVDGPIALAVGETTNLFVAFYPENYDPANGELLLTYEGVTDTEEQTTLVLMTGNNGIPIISVEPEELQFGARLQGDASAQPVKIMSQGGVPLVVDSIELADSSGIEFSLDYSLLPGFESGGKPTPENPLVLEIKEQVSVLVKFDPALGVEPDPENPIIVPTSGTVLIEHNTPEPTKTVSLEGIGLVGECPVAIVTVEEGDEVTPQTLLHLSGAQSFSPNGEITDYQWNVMQPEGSQSVFEPSAVVVEPTFEANVVGYYMFELTVWDSTGAMSCVPGVAEVVVLPDEDIHVELVWDTPGDPDQTDEGLEAGADLDLHFLHPDAQGLDVNEDGEPDGWYDPEYDVFWGNATPNWEDPDPVVKDDPRLDRDDKDGAGPENINLSLPVDGNVYRVGVHYFAAYSYGPSKATLRVYLSGVLAYEKKNVSLNNHDLWEVCTISWPEGDVLPIGDGEQILPNYQHPTFPPP